MKRLAWLLLLSLVFSACTVQHPLIGRWKTSDGKGAESVLVFKADGTFEAITGGEQLPGTWLFNEEIEPARLELEFEEQRKIVTIAKIEGDQLLLEHREKDQEMPTAFTDKAQKYRRQ